MAEVLKRKRKRNDLVNVELTRIDHTRGTDEWTGWKDAFARQFDVNRHVPFTRPPVLMPEFKIGTVPNSYTR